MPFSQSEPELTSPLVRNRMKILQSDWIYDDEDSNSGVAKEAMKKDNLIENNTEIVPSENSVKQSKRGRPRKSKEVKSVKKPKISVVGSKSQKTVVSESAEVETSNSTKEVFEGGVINLDEWLDDEVEEFEQKSDLNENQELSRPFTVDKLNEVERSDKVPEIIPVKELSKINKKKGATPGLPSPPANVFPALVKPGQTKMLKPLTVGVGRNSTRPGQRFVKSEQKMDESVSKTSTKAVISPKSMNNSHDMTNTPPEQHGRLSNTSPHHPPSPSVPCQASAPDYFPVKQLSDPGSSFGHILFRPSQLGMPRPPRPGMRRGSARPTYPRPVGARGAKDFPGPRLSNLISLTPMRRSSTQPQSQYFPVTSHLASYPHQEQSPSQPSPCNPPSLSNQDVSIMVAPSTRQGWMPPTGLTVERVPATEPTLTIPTLTTALHQLGQVEGRRKSVQYRLTEEQIRALRTLRTLGLMEEQLGGW